MGCVINKEYGKSIYRMIEFKNFYEEISFDEVNTNMQSWSQLYFLLEINFVYDLQIDKALSLTRGGMARS